MTELSLDTLPAAAQIRTLSELIARRDDSRITVEYTVAKGRCVGRGLMRTPEVAVQYCRMDAGAGLEYHVQDGCTEHLVVSEGIVHFESEQEPGVIRRMAAGDNVRIAPGEAHRVTAITDAAIIGITVPADEGYPYAADDAKAGR